MSFDLPSLADIARCLDATLLDPSTTPQQVSEFVHASGQLGVGGVCVNPSMLPMSVPEDCTLGTVIGFPHGTHHSLAKGVESKIAVDQGATAIEMVIDLGAAAGDNYGAVLADIAVVRDAAPRPITLGVIIETALLESFDDPEHHLRACCDAVMQAGADSIVTSTGFHPRGGASAQAVRILAQQAAGKISVKASGALTDAHVALDLLTSGATRLASPHPTLMLDGFADMGIS